MRIAPIARISCALLLLGAGSAFAQRTVAPQRNTTPQKNVTPDNQQPAIKPPPGAVLQPPIQKLKIPLWGFADLHTHPASHMSFGADSNGNGGIMWGKPGMDANAPNFAADLPPCPSDSHYGFDADPVRKETRKAIIAMIDSITGFTHASPGYPAFQNWPNAQSLTHQQMHVTEIRRAYDGGLRLMVADATDSQMLSNLWTKIGFNAFGNSVPPVDPNYDIASARKQLDFINREVAANSSWMRIVKSAAEARQAIAENKLAVILGVEMDKLSADQILELARTEGVRHVIPIHLTNNGFGGTAVYSDAFNASNNYLNGSFFRIQPDANLKFHLSRPSVLKSAELGAIKPVEVDYITYITLGYNTGANGQRNQLGLANPGELQKLMKAGLLLDVAHMGELTTDQTLGLCERYGYPVMDSHTGLRDATEHADSERDLKRSFAQRIAKLGGLIGYGTEGGNADRELLNLDPTQKPLIRFTGSDHELTRSLPTAGGDTGKQLYNLRCTIATGGDDLRGGNDNADIILTMKNGSKLPFPNINHGQGWGNGVVKTVTLPLPGGTRAGDILSFSLITHFGGGIGGDNWNVDSVRLVACERAMDTIGQFVHDYNEAVGVMLNRPAGIGTDMNGFAPQIPFTSEPMSYPITIASRTGVPPAGYHPPSLNKCVIGNRTFDFHNDGIAHYGMLADFMQAISQKPGGTQALDNLYKSADAVVEMWERTEAASKKL